MGKDVEKVKPVVDILDDRISAAMSAATGQETCAAIVKPATDPKFGDYQANGVMALAKRIKTDPRKLAEEVVKNLNVDDICEPPEIAGPGFINLRLKSDFIASRLLEINADSQNRLGVEKNTQPKTIVVDFSGPNIAKQMHVGHLRSTIIGDCICRLLEFLGHKVIRQNHIGDWGTHFGMLCALFDERLLSKSGAIENMELVSSEEILGELEAFYREAKRKFDSDKEFANTSRHAIAGLHSGKGIWRNHWESIIKYSKRHYEEIYRKLKVTLTDEDARGESSYKEDLPNVLQELKEKELAKESDGAVCVFPAGFKNKEGQPLPFIIQKSDGAYLYATTDLAALRYRVKELKANAIVYVTDARQKLHFEMLFATAKMAKFVSGDIELSHVMFGSVLGEDGAPLRTRSGENVKLKELLDEAVERAKKIVEEKNPELPADKKAQIANAVGIGAVKYADYSNNRTSDYIFSFDKMLAMDGNTAPYMQYAYARIKSIERKAQSRDVDVETELAGVKTLTLTEPDELDLAKYLLRYGEAIEAAVADYRPNYLTAYLYELAQKFSAFYTNCPVLDAGPDKRPTRLLLCDLTAKTIKHGLSKLLGIEVVEQM
ncbi:MAG: arginine--tRNA ligase [Planctomycetota bacterium]|jgi:arginyl-tRNA synthetase